MRDASCRLVTVLFDMLDELGIPPGRLVEGTGVSLEELRDEKNWLAWGDLSAIVERAAQLVGGEENLQEMACRYMFTTSGNWNFTIISRALSGPKPLYRALARWIAPQLFSMVEFRYEDLEGNRLRMHLSYDERYPVMPHLEQMISATLIGLPTQLGLPRSSVTCEVDGRSLVFTVLTPPSRSLVAYLLRVVRAVFAPGSLTRELESQAASLEARYAELLVVRKREEQASQAKSRFLALISHELRTPINGILGTAQLMEDTALTPDQEALVASNRASAAHLMELIEGILDFTRLHAGEVEPVVEDFDLTAVLAERIDRARPALEAAGDAGLLQSPPGPLWVRGDRGRLVKVLDSLLDNAARYTRCGMVRLSARPPERPGDHWLIEVADNGEGMTGEVLSHLFEPLRRGDESMTRPHGGLGLGLAVVRHSVEVMGGEVTCESAPGLGTRMRLSLPLQPAAAPPGVALRPAAAPAPVGAPAQAPAPPAARPGGAPLVLIVEDNPVNQMVISRMVSKLGYRVQLAEDGAKGLERYARSGAAVVLMDLQMPVMDGYEATRRIRTLEAERGWPRAPIFAVTAHAMDSDRRLALEAGVDRYLTKPVERELLEAVLQEVAPIEALRASA